MTATVPPVDRHDPPPSGDEATLLRAFLAFHRDTLRLKAAGLAEPDLHRTLPPSTMTLASLLTHLAYVEDFWCGTVLLGREPAEPWASLDWADDGDADWHLARHLDHGAARRLLDDAVAASDAAVEEALATPAGLDTVAARERHGEHVSLRWILIHLVEEYARHNGHADMLREAVDGATGE